MDAIWEGDEWTSWDEVDRHVYLQDLGDEFPHADPEVVEVFHDLLEDAARYRALAGRHLDIFGELGELYGEIRFGIKRHRVNAAGSDGRLGNDFIEIKTIGPTSHNAKIRVNRAGNFSKLIVVRIDSDYVFDCRVVSRRALKKGTGKWIRVSWSGLPALTDDGD